MDTDNLVIKTYDSEKEREDIINVMLRNSYELVKESILITGNSLQFLHSSQLSHEQVEMSEIDYLGTEIANLKITNIQKDLIINQLGQELTNIKLQLIGGEK